MKKRFFAVLMVITMFLSVFMTGCMGESSFTFVNNAVQKTEALTSVNATMALEMKLEGEGMTLEIPMVMEMKAKNLKSDSQVMRISATTEMFGQSTEMDIYQENDMSYVTANGVQYKMATSEMGDSAVSDKQMNQMIKAFPEEVMKDVEIGVTADGNKAVEITFSDEEFETVFADFIDSMKNSATGSLEVEADVSLSDMKVRIAVNEDGYICDYYLFFKMAVTAEGETINMTVEAAIKYIDPGVEVEVTAPEGYKDFPMMSAE